MCQSVSVSVCVSVCLSVYKISAERLFRFGRGFSINGCLPHWLEHYLSNYDRLFYYYTFFSDKRVGRRMAKFRNIKSLTLAVYNQCDFLGIASFYLKTQILYINKASSQTSFVQSIIHTFVRSHSNFK